MDVRLREFREDDIELLDKWATSIGSEKFMSRYRPKDPAVRKHCPKQGVLWFVVQVSERDVGTIWLESDVRA
ncbi:MAG: hypothetical protein ACRD4B_10330, partial [Acidobacteriota bacterium]